jgi:hypothetical protein
MDEPYWLVMLESKNTFKLFDYKLSLIDLTVLKKKILISRKGKFSKHISARKDNISNFGTNRIAEMILFI